MNPRVPSSPDLADQSTISIKTDDLAAASDTPAQLKVVHSPHLAAVGRRIALPAHGESLSLGRSTGSSGTILDSRVSREHARVVWDPASKSYRVGDADSANGTRCNGQPVTTTTIQHHDVLRLGDTLLVVEKPAETALLDERVARAATSELSILILGETGTGKEVLARRLHDASSRSGPFVPVNCAAVPRELIAAELFGHVAGAFSGARGARQGLFATAHQGTLFLDEIGDLPFDIQPALLRALEERRVRPVGSDREVDTDARVIAATHHDLEAECEDGAFRNDLFARLAQVVFRVPPLRERRSELLALAAGFANRELLLTADAAEAMLLWNWPRNIRELKTLIEAFCLLDDEATLSLEDLSQHNSSIVEAWKRQRSLSRRPSAESDRADARRMSSAPPLDGPALSGMLSDAGGNVAKVARQLGLSRTKLYRVMERLGVSPSSSRSVTIPADPSVAPKDSDRESGDPKRRSNNRSS